MTGTNLSAFSLLFSCPCISPKTLTCSYFHPVWKGWNVGGLALLIPSHSPELWGVGWGRGKFLSCSILTVFVGPAILACTYGLFHVIFFPRQQLTSWQTRQWECVSLVSFYTFCFRMQDFLIVCLGFSKSLFTNAERCQTHALKNVGQVYMCLKNMPSCPGPFDALGQIKG